MSMPREPRVELTEAAQRALIDLTIATIRQGDSLEIIPAIQQLGVALEYQDGGWDGRSDVSQLLINTHQVEGKTLLEWAAGTLYSSAFNPLVRKQADGRSIAKTIGLDINKIFTSYRDVMGIFVRDFSDITALHIAVLRRNAGDVRALLALGADITAEIGSVTATEGHPVEGLDGMTPLELAQHLQSVGPGVPLNDIIVLLMAKAENGAHVLMAAKILNQDAVDVDDVDDVDWARFFRAVETISNDARISGINDAQSLRADVRATAEDTVEQRYLFELFVEKSWVLSGEDFTQHYGALATKGVLSGAVALNAALRAAVNTYDFRVVEYLLRDVRDPVFKYLVLGMAIERRSLVMAKMALAAGADLVFCGSAMGALRESIASRDETDLTPVAMEERRIEDALLGTLEAAEAAQNAYRTERRNAHIFAGFWMSALSIALVVPILFAYAGVLIASVFTFPRSRAWMDAQMGELVGLWETQVFGKGEPSVPPQTPYAPTTADRFDAARDLILTRQLDDEKLHNILGHISADDFRETFPTHAGVRLLEAALEYCDEHIERQGLVKAFMTRGADINTLIDGQTLLHRAIAEGGEAGRRRFNALIALDAEPDIRDNEGNTPLHAAAARGLDGWVRNLTSRRGARLDSVNVARNIPLHLAIQSGSVNTIRSLLGPCVDLEVLNHINNVGQTPLDLLNARQSVFGEQYQALAEEFRRLGARTRAALPPIAADPQDLRPGQSPPRLG